MKEMYYIFKEEDLKRVSGPVQNEWDKTAIFKQELLDICKKVTVDDEKTNICDPDRAKCPWCGNIGIQYFDYAEGWCRPYCDWYLNR